jgi:hypothetical protein
MALATLIYSTMYEKYGRNFSSSMEENIIHL